MWKDGPSQGRRSMLRGSEKYMPLPLNAQSDRYGPSPVDNGKPSEVSEQRKGGQAVMEGAS